MHGKDKYQINLQRGDYPSVAFPGGDTKAAAETRAETRLRALEDEGYRIDPDKSNPKALDWTLTLKWTGETARVFVTETVAEREAVTA